MEIDGYLIILEQRCAIKLTIGLISWLVFTEKIIIPSPELKPACLKSLKHLFFEGSSFHRYFSYNKV